MRIISRFVSSMVLLFIVAAVFIVTIGFTCVVVVAIGQVVTETVTSSLVV